MQKHLRNVTKECYVLKWTKNDWVFIHAKILNVCIM